MRVPALAHAISGPTYTYRFENQLGELERIFFTAVRQIGITTDAALQVEHGLAVLPIELVFGPCNRSSQMKTYPREPD